MIHLHCNPCDKDATEMDVRFGMTCDNACPFCFNKIGRPAGKFDLQAIIKSTLEEAPYNCINIVGGEPLLACRLDDLYGTSQVFWQSHLWCRLSYS